MNTRIAKKLVSELPLNINDIARLIPEMAEALGERAAGLPRVEMLRQEWCDKNLCRA